MDSYTPLLEKTRLPQPSLQKFAVIAIFSKLRSAPSYLNPDSEPGREAITQCLRSTSPAVVDQSVRELCRLVSDSKMDLSRGFLELQSALEGSDSKFVNLFVKGLGFLVQLGFGRNCGSWQLGLHENHPFVKILSCRNDAQSALVQQVLAFMTHSRRLGIAEVCEFLRPFVNFSILRIPFSESSSYLFARQMVSSMASFCCLFPNEAVPVFKLLLGCLKHLPCKNSEELRSSYYFMECVVDAYVVVLRHLAGEGLLVAEAQLFGVYLSETILSSLSCSRDHSGGSEPIVELAKQLLVVLKNLSLRYIPQLSATLLSLFPVLIQSEMEHEQLSLLKLLIFIVKWKRENENIGDKTKIALGEELLFIFPVINLMSSASKSVKGAAADLLFTLENSLVQLSRASRIELDEEGRFPSISSPGSIAFRLLQHIWVQDQFCASFLNFASCDKTDIRGLHVNSRPWGSQLREYCLWVVERRKSSLPLSQSQQFLLTEIPSFLSAISGVLMVHHSLGNIATDLLAAISVMDPKQGVPLLMSVLFYSKQFSVKEINCPSMLPKLLAMLPSLASHSAMIPLVVQTILPMIQKDGKQVLYATGTRLLCQTWAANDRAFGSLQAILHPKMFIDFKTEESICISLAASIREVCQRNPDRGVDLILSVSACIESPDSIIQALGFQSLAHLCEADVIDFYTAWDVIAKHVLDYSTDPVLAESLCLLLRWGAMDAEAYSEASRDVLQTLWSVATFTHANDISKWAKARSSAFEALTQYEVSHIENGIPEFKRLNRELLFSETNQVVLKAMEEFQVKIINHEHENRRRLVKEKKVAGSKIEKLLDVFPQVLFPPGKKSNTGQLPGAALLCLSFAPKDLNKLGLSRASLDVHAGYEIALVEIAASLPLSRNVFIALLSLQSWKLFMRRWMRANISSVDAKIPSTALDKTSKAANDILKSIMRLAEEAIPRLAENIALAVGALCLVLPPSAHSIKSTASKFLLNWLFQYEHEYRQWSAAVSLGLISSCLHVTDHKQKFDNITGLIEVFSASKSTLVKGACGVGLGFSCQDLLTTVQAVDNIGLEDEKYKMQEVDLLGKIVRALLLMTSHLSQGSFDVLEGLSPCFSRDIKVMEPLKSFEKFDDLEEDIWGVAGLALGLAGSLGAMYRAGEYDTVLKIKDLIISWIPYLNSPTRKSNFPSEGSDKVLSVGSCLALPTVVALCRKVEMMDDSELHHILNGYTEIISELLSVKKSGTFYQSLLTASCVGAGSLLAFILNEGVHPVEVQRVKDLLELFRKCYSCPFPPVIHLGGMLGVVNAMGAGAGILVDRHHFSSSMKNDYAQKESSYVLGPLLSNPVCEPYLTTLVQEIFLVAQNSDDLQMQQNAAWAASFLRSHLWSKELQNVDNRSQAADIDSKTVARSFPDDSVVVKLSMWLMNLDYSGERTVACVGTVVTVLRCLSCAPRLSTMDWGLIIRRCMRYEAQVSELFQSDSGLKRGALREECVRFSIAHANQSDPLLTFLDELSDLPRFRTLEPILQSCLLFHLDGLIKTFSNSRLQKLFEDISKFFSSDSSYQVYSTDQKSSLRIACWKGLYQCLDEASLGSPEYTSHFEKCMELLFSLLPLLESADVAGTDFPNEAQEWFEVVKCLAKAHRDWLLDFLQVPLVDPVQGHGQSNNILRKIVAKAKLVRTGSIPSTELGKLKAYLLNAKPHGIWNALVEVVAALQYAEGSIKRQWLVDTVEISCVSSNPSTAIQFLGLLAGSCSKYMALLILDKSAVLNDLPVTLPSLLADPDWEAVAESVVHNLWASTVRIHDWVTRKEVLNGTPTTITIDESERDSASFLLHVMHHACARLKEYLPLEKQLKLTNMVAGRSSLTNG